MLPSADRTAGAVASRSPVIDDATSAAPAHAHAEPSTATAARAPTWQAVARVSLTVLAAAALYGGWAAWANRAHGVDMALRAGLTQGASSAVSTLIIGTLLEAVHAALPPRRHRALVATLVAASVTAVMHVCVHLTMGTPEILRAVLPSVLMGYVFAGAYARALSGPQLRVTYQRAADLTADEREVIWNLFSRSVQRNRGDFEDKLARTGEVFLGRARDGSLVAFGAVDVIEVDVGHGTETLLYTNWAAIDPAHRGTNVIQRVGFRYFLRARLRHPLRPIYWLFTASTYTSYLLLVRNYRAYWPRREEDTPAHPRALLDAAMRRAEPSTWDASAGVLRRHGASRYREGVVDDEPAVLDHPTLGPAVRYYRARNAGQGEGDSLACLCPLTAANWWYCLRVAAQRRRRSGARSPR